NLLWGEHLNVWLAKKQGLFQAKESFPPLILRLAGQFYENSLVPRVGSVLSKFQDCGEVLRLPQLEN
ncbi:MAG: hypothetical protein ACPGJO_11370, partial [bacterium]